jgi:hypothetical protein
VRDRGANSWHGPSRCCPDPSNRTWAPVTEGTPVRGCGVDCRRPRWRANRLVAVDSDHGVSKFRLVSNQHGRANASEPAGRYADPSINQSMTRRPPNPPRRGPCKIGLFQPSAAKLLPPADAGGFRSAKQELLPSWPSAPLIRRSSHEQSRGGGIISPTDHEIRRRRRSPSGAATLPLIMPVISINSRPAALLPNRPPPPRRESPAPPAGRAA